MVGLIIGVIIGWTAFVFCFLLLVLQFFLLVREISVEAREVE